MKRLFLFVLSILPFFLSAQNQPLRNQVAHLLKTHQYDRAEKILQQHQDRPDALYYLGVVELLKGNWDKAIDAAEKGAKVVMPDSSKARFYDLLGDIYAVKAQNSGMLSLIFIIGKIKKNWQRAIEYDSARISAYQKLFSFYLMAPGFAGGDKDKALNIARKVLTFNSPLGQTMLGQYYQKEKKYDLAEQAFKKALHLAPDSINVLKEAAYFYLRIKNYPRSRKLFAKIVSLKPQSPLAYDALSDWYLEAGKKDSALIVLNKAIALDSLNQQIIFKKARVLADLGQFEASRSLCNKLLRQEMFFSLRDQINLFLKKIKDK